MREDAYLYIVHVLGAVLLKRGVEVCDRRVGAQDPRQLVQGEGQHSTYLPLERGEIVSHC